MARKSSPGIAISSLQEALQTKRVREALPSLDRRSLKSSRALVADLGTLGRPSEIARGLGVSTQKYVAIRRGIEAGKIGSPVLNDLLREGRAKIVELSDRPRSERGEYRPEKPVGKRREFKVDYIQAGEEFVRSKMRFATKIKTFASLQSARNWYGGVTGGKEYFWIVKNKRGGYSIYDVRTAAERSRKGITGKSRAQRVLDEYENEPRREARHGGHKQGKARTSGGRKKKG